MQSLRRYFWLPFSLILLAGCIGVQATVEPPIEPLPTEPQSTTTLAPTTTLPPTATAEPTLTISAEVASPSAEPPSEIVMPISVYILDDASGALSSQRTLIEVADIYERVNGIWAQANIVIDVQTIERIEVPNELLFSIARGDFLPFFRAVNSGQIVLPNLTRMSGFYVRDLGGPNGINPLNSDVFLVMDTPSVHDERVTSHEIGHIFGLHHVLDDPGRLMFSGTNGTNLTDEEIFVARYAAQGMLDGVR